jgi:hypothetical protein
MYVVQVIYPLALASVNMAVGWLLYHLFESVFGGLLIIIGLLVAFARIGGGMTEDTLVPGESG